jgi:hypothetical protein
MSDFSFIVSILNIISNVMQINLLDDSFSSHQKFGVKFHISGARFTNFQELFLTRILNAILNRLRIDS